MTRIAGEIVIDAPADVRLRRGRMAVIHKAAGWPR
jgi:hypothetical protein